MPRESRAGLLAAGKQVCIRGGRDRGRGVEIVCVSCVMIAEADGKGRLGARKVMSRFPFIDIRGTDSTMLQLQRCVDA